MTLRKIEICRDFGFCREFFVGLTAKYHFPTATMKTHGKNQGLGQIGVCRELGGQL
jgi:hypothetical protein